MDNQGKECHSGESSCRARPAPRRVCDSSYLGDRTRPFGISYIEVLVAIAVIGVLLTGVAQTVALVTHQQRASHRRLVALNEAANIMERLMASPYRELSTQQASLTSLSDSTQHALPRAVLSVVVSRAPHDSAAKRLAVEIRWKNGDREIKPVRLVAWKYDPEGKTP